MRHASTASVDEARRLGQRGERAQHGLALAHLAAADQVAHELDVLVRRQRPHRGEHERAARALVGADARGHEQAGRA